MQELTLDIYVLECFRGFVWKQECYAFCLRPLTCKLDAKGYFQS